MLRTGLLIFLVLCIFLVALRTHIYQQSVNTSYREIHTLLEAHSESIEQAVEDNDPAYAQELIAEILRETHDKRLYLALHGNEGIIAGNLRHWPVLKNTKAVWQEIALERKDSLPLHLLVKVMGFRQHLTLLVGYDLSFVDSLRKTLVAVLLENIVISFALSLVLSVGIMWLIGQQLRRVNRTCEAVMQGQLAQRVALRGSYDQFDQLGGNINRMLDWISTLLDSVQESGRALAHDLRTPLSRHRLELRAIAELPNVPREVRSSIHQAVQRLDTLVEMFENLLTISRAQSREGRDIFEAFDLAMLVRDIVEFYEDVFEQRNILVEEHIPGTPLMIHADKQLLGQAVMNLVDNAVTYVPEGSRIAITLTQRPFEGKEKTETVITVADNGPGIPQEYREKVKESFFRMEKSRHTKGTGLGLSIVVATATLHQGTLVLEDNAPGVRAVLTLHTQTV